MKGKPENFQKSVVQAILKINYLWFDRCGKKRGRPNDETLLA